MSEFKIRPANEKDADLILSFIKELAVFEKLAHEVESTPEGLRATLFGADPSAEVVIGEHAGKPAAFALFFHTYSTFRGKRGLYLEDLFVRPEYRGRGYGKAMLVHLSRLAKERDCGRFEWSVLDWNKNAIDFYESLGAKAMNDWTVYRLDEPSISKLSNL